MVPYWPSSSFKLMAMASPLSIEQLYRSTLYDISQYIGYYYVTVSEDVPAAISTNLQDFDDLRTQSFSKEAFRAALIQGAIMMVDCDLSLGADDKERRHIFANLADLGFFVEADKVHADFVL